MLEYYYMNQETGELLTREEMLKQAADMYDVGDPTNGISLWEYYTETEIPVDEN